jgi:hypothetical protein
MTRQELKELLNSYGNASIDIAEGWGTLPDKARKRMEEIEEKIWKEIEGIKS